MTACRGARALPWPAVERLRRKLVAPAPSLLWPVARATLRTPSASASPLRGHCRTSRLAAADALTTRRAASGKENQNRSSLRWAMATSHSEDRRDLECGARQRVLPSQQKAGGVRHRAKVPAHGVPAWAPTKPPPEAPARHPSTRKLSQAARSEVWSAQTAPAQWSIWRHCRSQPAPRGGCCSGLPRRGTPPALSASCHCSSPPQNGDRGGDRRAPEQFRCCGRPPSSGESRPVGAHAPRRRGCASAASAAGRQRTDGRRWPVAGRS
mmetsp:Transcript_115711/g.327213  ORF Transcript_115711/g.327213 Transcript_115711/m.327213 type:complete len:267 (+) Transcript_115711:983-1783(+)